MIPRVYTFGIQKTEYMEIISGKVEILLSGLKSNWEEIKTGEFLKILVLRLKYLK